MQLSADGEAWVERHRAEHAANPRAFTGGELWAYRGLVREFCEGLGAKSLLDYGCGKGVGWLRDGLREFLGLERVALWDPAYPMFAERPAGKFDVVVCTDVIEHVPEGDVPGVLADIAGYAEKGVFLSICCRPSRGLFRDGTNPHATVKPREWWAGQLDGVKRAGLALLAVETR